MKTLSQIGSALALSGMMALGFIQSANAAEDRGQFTAGDYKFVREAAKGGGIEVALGQLAQEKAVDPDVRHFADHMVGDHTKANDELAHLAAMKGAVIPDTSREQKDMVDGFKDLSGADFDKAYIKQMVRDHEKTVDLFQKAAGDSEDPDLKNWVIKTLPTIQEHLDMAHKLHAQLMPEK